MKYHSIKLRIINTRLIIEWLLISSFLWSNTILQFEFEHILKAFSLQVVEIERGY